VRPSGESNREASLLTGEHGLLRATVFGGPKSRLRSHVSPFHSGRAWIYGDPAKDSKKLADFDVENWRPGIREMYERAAAADEVAGTVLASYGGGGSSEAAILLAETALDALTDSSGENCPGVIAWFMWKWAGLLGLCPDLTRCCQCGAPAPEASPLAVSPAEGGPVCRACRASGRHPGLFPVSRSCRLWLETPPARPGPPPDPRALTEAAALATAVLSAALGAPPASGGRWRR